MIWRHDESKQGDESVCRDSRDTTSRDQGCECNLTGQDRAKEGCSEDEDDSDCIARLTLRVDFTDPA
jgi:hypothetical protein